MSDINPEGEPKEPFDLQKYGDDLLAEMQTPEWNAGIDKVFSASPEELQDMIRKGRLREAVFDGTLKAEIDESVDDPDLEVGNEF